MNSSIRIEDSVQSSERVMGIRVVPCPLGLSNYVESPNRIDSLKPHLQDRGGDSTGGRASILSKQLRVNLDLLEEV